MFRKHIEAAGIPFFAAGTQDEQQLCNTIDFSPERLMEGLMTQFRQHVGRNVPRVTRIIEEWHRAGEELLIVTPPIVNPAWPVCEHFDIPVVMAYYTPATLPLNREDFVMSEVFEGCPEWRARWLRYPRHALRISMYGPPQSYTEYNEFRAEAGIGPLYMPYKRLLRRLTGRSSLALRIEARMLLVPQWFAEPLGWMARRRVRCLGFPQLDESQQHRPGSEVEKFIDTHGAPVVFAPGTGVQAIDDFCQPIAAACEAMGAPGILLSKHGREAFARMPRVGKQPLLHVEFVDDLAWLLARARVLVHTGGIGTIAQAIRAGVVQIIHPLANDQPRNGLRLVMNGLGGLLFPDAWTGPEIAATCQQLATSEMHVQYRRHFAELARSEDGAATAADLMAQLALRLDAKPRARVREHTPLAAASRNS